MDYEYVSKPLFFVDLKKSVLLVLCLYYAGVIFKMIYLFDNSKRSQFQQLDLFSTDALTQSISNIGSRRKLSFNHNSFRLF